MLEISFVDHAIRDFSYLQKDASEQIMKATTKKLCRFPELFGKRLSGSLREYWSLRVGDYRVVYKTDKKSVCVMGISHRKNVYKVMDNRIK